jgi:hypothetical protein
MKRSSFLQKRALHFPEASPLEIDPGYVDTAIRRWQAFTGKDAIHFESGEAFDDRAARPPDNAIAAISRRRAS